jgi:hypothetical protein
MQQKSLQFSQTITLNFEHSLFKCQFLAKYPSFEATSTTNDLHIRFELPIIHLE